MLAGAPPLNADFSKAGSAQKAGAGLLSQCCPNKTRLDVDHPVVKTCFCSCAPVIYFVRVRNDEVTSGAVGSSTAIIEPLHSVHGVADGIGVVPVWFIGMACKERFDPLQARLRRSEPHPIIGRGTARSFKTSLGLVKTGAADCGEW